MTAIAEATAVLSSEGHDRQSISELFLNGAAALLHGDCTEKQFVELARDMWRAKERQVELLRMLDRVEASPEYRVRFRKRGSGIGDRGSARRGSGSGNPDPGPRTPDSAAVRHP